MKPLLIGITGGIGSGKSIICRVLSILGYPVFDADAQAKIILENHEIQVKVITLLGDKAYLENGKPNREFIASVVFNDNEKLKSLNGIIHPAVQKQFHEWVRDNQNAQLVFKEAAIMFESGSHKEMDKIIVVSSPIELRVQRTMERDGKSRDEVLTIISKQLPAEEVIQRSDYVIINDNHTPVIPQVQAILNELHHPNS